MPRRYTILDVFTAEPLSGNQLAVVHECDGLDTARMQAIAAEFRLSETVFVLPPENALHTARIRIFMPAGELPFAGHPTIGTAVALASDMPLGDRDGTAAAVIVLEETVGPVRCGVTLRDAGGHAVFDAPRLPEEVASAADASEIAAALGMAVADIGFENHRPTEFTAGVPYTFVPIRNLAAMAALAPQAPSPLYRGGAAIFCYTRETVGVGRQFHARMFAPASGVLEDSATGSAAVALAGVVRKFDALPDGAHRLTIEQGFEMGRPSLLSLEIDVIGSRIEAIRLAGDAVIVAEGTLRA